MRDLIMVHRLGALILLSYIGSPNLYAQANVSDLVQQDVDTEQLLVDELPDHNQATVESTDKNNNEQTQNESTMDDTDDDDATLETEDPMDEDIETGTDEADEDTADYAGKETGPNASPKATAKPTVALDKGWLKMWARGSAGSSENEEGKEPNIDNMSKLQLTGRDVQLYFGGRIKDDVFFYDHVDTLRTDYHDRINFVRHKMYLDFSVTQGTQKYGKPVSEASIRLMNYVYWQQESAYTPLVIDDITVPQLDNLNIARDVKVRTLIPLVFVEQAWFKVNLENVFDLFEKIPTYIKVGYFPYSVGRGVTLGFHEDLAVEYLGWAGEGGFTRYPFMPPGILFRTQLFEGVTYDSYINLWRETNASISDTLKPERWERINGPWPERGSGKDRITWVNKIDYEQDFPGFGKVLLEPYFTYVDAPEQGIEFRADASAKIYTLGMMADWRYKNWGFNVEIAGQGGHQHVHAIDRNIDTLNRDSNGNIQETFTHVLTRSNADTPTDPVHPQTPVQRIQNATPPGNVPTNADRFEPQNQLSYIVQADNNRDLSQQDKNVVNDNGQEVTIINANTRVLNAATFGNERFRKPYSLYYQGFMALADLTYEFDKYPFKITGSLGYLSGDNYPYNEEVSRHFKGFIPMRSRYKGLGVQNFLIFDRLELPRPVNICYRTLYAFNNVKDLSNLEYFGLGLTWYPYKNNRPRMSVTTDLMFLWEATTLKKWDKNGKHWDSAIEKQLVRLRNTTANGTQTLFQGWETTENARRMLGTEVDIKILYRLLDHCNWSTTVTLFFPGGLYKDLDGQPNDITRRVDEHNYLHYDSLGHAFAFAFMTGLNYRF